MTWVKNDGGKKVGLLMQQGTYRCIGRLVSIVTREYVKNFTIVFCFVQSEIFTIRKLNAKMGIKSK